MNYLAHSFLSGSSEQVIVGNFIGDFVKGNKHQTYPPEIQKGILLHRFIDSYADNSPIIKESKQIFQPVYGKYSGIIIDVMYDHFLSVHWNEYSKIDREQFIQNVYTTILKFYPVLPERAHRLAPSIVYHNWMRYYASFYGIEKVLKRMSIRTSLPGETKECIALFKKHYSELDEHFQRFFPEMIKAVENKIKNPASL